MKYTSPTIELEQFLISDIIASSTEEPQNTTKSNDPFIQDKF